MFSALTFALLVVTLVSSKRVDDDMLLFWRRSNSEACKPFTTYNVECNKCVCSADGVSYCTRMLCSNNDDDKLEAKVYSDEVD